MFVAAPPAQQLQALRGIQLLSIVLAALVARHVIQLGSSEHIYDRAASAQGWALAGAALVLTVAVLEVRACAVITVTTVTTVCSVTTPHIVL